MPCLEAFASFPWLSSHSALSPRPSRVSLQLVLWSCSWSDYGISPAFLSISWSTCRFARVLFSDHHGCGGCTRVPQPLPGPATGRPPPLLPVSVNADRASSSPVVSSPSPRVRSPRSSLVLPWCRCLGGLFIFLRAASNSPTTYLIAAV